MRDILLLTIIAGLAAIAIRRPFAGLLAWAWFSIMTPHQLAYGVYGIPLNVVLACATLIGFALTRELWRIRFDPVIISMAAFTGWLVVAQYFSLNPEHSAPFADRFIKTLVFATLCGLLATTRLRLHALIWILAVGVGFFAAKGALFTVATFGEFRVQGLPGTVIEDNNHFAIAVATCLPLMLYLRSQAKHAWLRAVLLAVFALSIFAIIGTHSRGGLIALGVFAVAFWMRSRKKLALAAALALLLFPATAFMPSKWSQRMSTIAEAGSDESFQGRVDAWVINWKLAKENPITGGGLRNSYLPEIAADVDLERAESARAAHSIYFETLGGAGFVGLALFFWMLLAAFSALSKAINETQQKDDDWRPQLARALQVCLLVFCVGGASVSMEMWDGYLIIIGLASALAALTRNQLARTAAPAGQKRFRQTVSMATSPGHSRLSLRR
ncbi:MAG: putative O-glycosylation ligase, exosortase A system-associated [Pseudomonadota bacterium]